MRELVRIVLVGVPHGKGRPRFVRQTGRAYTPEKTRNYESDLRLAGQEAMGSRVPVAGPLRVVVEALMPIPASWSKKKQAAARTGALRPCVRPDWENLAKTLDGLNEVVWRDDAQIVEGMVTKLYATKPQLIVTVTELAADG